MQLNARRVSGHKFEPLSIVFSEFPEIFVMDMGAEITNRFLRFSFPRENERHWELRHEMAVGIV